MLLALVITVVYVSLLWLVFFKLKLLKFSIAWGIVSAFVGIHVLLIFMIGLRFITPYSTETPRWCSTRSSWFRDCPSRRS